MCWFSFLTLTFTKNIVPNYHIFCCQNQINWNSSEDQPLRAMWFNHRCPHYYLSNVFVKLNSNLFQAGRSSSIWLLCFVMVFIFFFYLTNCIFIEWLTDDHQSISKSIDTFQHLNKTFWHILNVISARKHAFLFSFKLITWSILNEDNAQITCK